MDLGSGHAHMGDPNPNTNISHSPMMGLTHPIHQYFKLAQEIHIGERIVRPETHTKGISNIETQFRSYNIHQPQNSYPKKCTYISQAFLVTHN